MTRKTIVGTNACVGGPATTATIDSSNNPQNSVVNNVNVNLSRQGSQVEYETVKYNGDPDVTVIRPVQRDSEEKVVSRDLTIDEDRDILLFLVKTYHDIIVSDPKMVINLIDQSGLVVLGSTALISLIAKVCAVDDAAVKIEIEEEVDIGCCGTCSSKITPLKPIRKIKVNKDGTGFNDFELTYNSLYNKIIDDYGVSLEKVYEPLFAGNA